VNAVYQYIHAYEMLNGSLVVYTVAVYAASPRADNIVKKEGIFHKMPLCLLFLIVFYCFNLTGKFGPGGNPINEI
jgi:hypothetical protein